MADDATLVLKVDSRDVVRADTALDGLSGQARETAKSAGVMSDAAKVAATAFATLAASFSVREIIEYTDRWTSLNNSISQVTESTEELISVTADLRTVARDSRTSVEATANLYVKMTKATEDLGISSDRLLGVTSTINKAFALSGTTTAEAAGSIAQLGQALSAGALRGDEFNSIAEGAPEIMRAISKFTGMATGDLRDFAATGGITAEIVINSLESASKTIGESFSKSTATFAQSMTIADDNLLEFIGSSKIAKGVTEGLGDAIVSLTDSLPEIEAFVTSFITQFEIIAQDIDITLDLIGNSFSNATGDWGEDAAHVVNFISEAFTHLPVNIRSAIQLITVEFASLIAEANLVGESLAKALNPFSDVDVDISAETKAKISKFGSQIAEAVTTINPLGEGVGFDDLIAGFGALRDAAVETGASILEESEKVGEGFTKISNEHAEGVKLLDDARMDSLSLIVDENATQKAAFSARIKESKTLLSTKEKERDALRQRLKDLGKLGATYKKTETDAVKFAKSFEKIRDKALPVEAILRNLDKEIGAVQRAISEGLDIDIGTQIIESLDEIAAKSIKTATTIKDSFSPLGEAINEFVDGTKSGISSLKGMAEEGSSTYKNLDILLQALNATQAVNAVLNQTSGDPYTAFARVAAMAATVASLGFSVGGAGGSFSEDTTSADRQATQGTGSVLGDFDAKSASIAEAVELTAGATSELVGINRGMLEALQSLQMGIGGASNLIARGGVGGGIAPNVRTGDDIAEMFSKSIQPKLFDIISDGVADVAIEVMDVFSLGGFTLTELIFGGKSKLLDEGIKFGGAIGDVLVEGFSTFKVKKNVFSSSKTVESFAEISEDVANQFALVFEGISNSVSAGASALGLASGTIQTALDTFVIETQQISLKGLSGEQQSEELLAVFGNIFDGLASAVLPDIEAFQRVGEGLGETLARVATQVQVTQEVVQRLGLTFADLAGTDLIAASERLVTLAGGIGEFTKSVSSFVSNFATEEQKFEILQSDLNRALEQQNILLPATRQGYFDLLQAQEAATQSGAENIATLLRLEGTADQYYTSLEESAKESARIADVAAKESENAANAAAKKIIDDARVISDALAAMLQKALEVAISGSDTALSTLSASIDAQKDLLKTDLDAALDSESTAFKDLVKDTNAELKNRVSNLKFASDAQIDAIKEAEKARLNANKMVLDAAKDGLRDISKEVSGISSAFAKLQSVIKSPGSRRTEALDFLRGALSSGDLSGAGTAAGTAADISSSEFDSSVDFARAVSTTSGLLGQLESAGLTQETIAEQTVAVLTGQTTLIRDQSKLQIESSKLNTEALIAQAETQAALDIETANALHEEDKAFLLAQHEVEVGFLDSLLAEAQNQLNGLRDIDASVKSVGAALSGFRNAIFAEVIARSNVAPELVGPVQELAGPPKPPGFANGTNSFGGGMRMVGERGPELEFTGASRITSNSDLKSMLSQERVIEELKASRLEHGRLLTELAFANRKIVKKLDKWDGAGLPNFVETQQVEVV